MPRADHYDVSIEPICDTVGISLVVHVGTSVEAPGPLIQDARLLEVGACMGYGSAGHVDSAPHHQTLMVPHRREFGIADEALFFSPSLKVEQNNIVLIQHVQARASGCHLDLDLAPRHLDSIEVARELLEVNHVVAGKVLQNDRETHARSYSLAS